MAFKKKYQLAVFIMRGQIVHRGHESVINRALQLSNRVLILLGSAASGRSHRNPFLYHERMIMLHSIFSNKSISYRPLNDATYNDALWTSNVQSAVNAEIQNLGIGNLDQKKNITLIGHSKDDTSYYLKMFPQWSSEEVENFSNVNSTQLRSIYFSNDCELDSLSYAVSAPVLEILESFKNTDAYKEIVEEYVYIKNYKKAWESSPYPPIFVTVDSVVVQSGHVLLIKRRASPGKGKWALPGGFLDQNETIIDSAIRELREETGIKVPAPVLKGSIFAREVFDDPNRSARGRTITNCIGFKLADSIDFPHVRGADDALKAKWIPFNDLREENMFEDHYFIVQNLLARI